MKKGIQKSFLFLQSKREQKQKEVTQKKELKETIEAEEVIAAPLEKAETTEDVDVQYSYDDTSGQIALKVDEENEEQELQEVQLDDTPINEMGIDNLNDDYILPGIELLDEPVKQTQQREKSAIQKTVKTL